MVDRKMTTAVDPLKCTGCGLCIRVCPDRTLSMVGDRAVVTGERCMHCAHCAAVCPADAVHVAGLTIGRRNLKRSALAAISGCHPAASTQRNW